MFIVTGANGFIGSAMVWHLNQLGYINVVLADEVEVKGRPRPLSSLKYTEFFHSKEFLSALENEKETFVDVKGIFHMGACSSTTETDKEYLRKTNTDYTRSLFLYAQKRKIPFIYASSAAVYGSGEQGFDDKKASTGYRSLNLYGKSKLDFDLWVEEGGSWESAPWFGLRFFNVYGPNEYHKASMRSLVIKASEQIEKTGKLKLFKSHRDDYEDGRQLRDFVYVKDVVRWMWELYEKRFDVQSGIYNMGFGKAKSWLDLAGEVFKALGKPMNIEWIDIPENIRNQYQYFTEADMKKWQAQGLSLPDWSLEKGIEDYVQNYILKGNQFLSDG